MPNLGFSEILLILVIALLVLGAKRLPEMGASMGKGIREFKRSLSEVGDSPSNAEVPPARQLDSAPLSSGGEPKKLSQ